MALLCDRMTYNYKTVSVVRHGINKDDIGPIAKASFEETPDMFLKAALTGELDMMRGISANIMCGQQGLYGTNAFQVVLDMDKMKTLQHTVEIDRKSNAEKVHEQFINNVPWYPSTTRCHF